MEKKGKVPKAVQDMNWIEGTVNKFNEYKPTKEQIEGAKKAGLKAIAAKKVKGWVPKGWIAVEFPDSEVLKELKSLKKALAKLKGTSPAKSDIAATWNTAIEHCVVTVDKRIKKHSKTK